MKWEIEYNNDVGENDDCFQEWWSIISEGKEYFRAFSEGDANMLIDLLNKNEP